MATPATPSRIKITAVSRSAIDVFWSSTGVDTLYYLLERSVDAGATWTQINKLPQYQTLYHDTGLTEGQQYCYRVRGSNNGGNGSYSSVVCTPTITHTILSTTHRDTTPASLVRGDLLVAIGASPLLTRYGKGTQYQVLTGGANEPTWGAVDLGQATALAGVGTDGKIPYAATGALAFSASCAWDEANKNLLIGGPHGLGYTNVVSNVGIGPAGASIISMVTDDAANPSFGGYRARSGPSKVLTDDYLAAFGGRGYATAGWESAARGSFCIRAAEDHDTAHGTYATVRTTAIGNTSAADVARFDNASGIKNAVTNLYTTKDYTLTIPATGTAALGMGAANTIAYWSGINTLTTLANGAGYLKNDGAGALSWDTGTGWALIGNAGTDPAVNFLGTTDAVDLILARNSAARVRIGVDGVGIGLIPPIPNCLLNIECDTGLALHGAVLIEDIDGGVNGHGNAAIEFLRAGAHFAEYALGILSNETCFALWSPGSGGYYFDIAYLTGQFTIHGRDNTAPQLKVAHDSSNYFTAYVSAGGVTTLATLPVGAGFVFTPPVTFSAAPILSTMTAGWLPYMGASKEVIGSANATLDASGNVYFASSVGIGISPAVILDIATPDAVGDIAVARWGLKTEPNMYSLSLTQRVTAGLAKWSFGTINAGNAYNDTIVLDRGNVGIRTASPGYLLDMEVSGGGYYSAADHQWHNGSSIRWKKDVQTLANALGIVCRLRGVEFVWKSNAMRDCGLIAEEVGNVIPSAVAWSKEDPGYADGIGSGKLDGWFVEAIKELRQRVEILESIQPTQ